MNLEEYYDNIYRYCYLHTQNRHTAEDLTQETFLKFLETSNYQDRGKPLAFLYTIARNLCIDHIRQNSKAPMHAAGLLKHSFPLRRTQNWQPRPSP